MDKKITLDDKQLSWDEFLNRVNYVVGAYNTNASSTDIKKYIKVAIEVEKLSELLELFSQGYNAKLIESKNFEILKIIFSSAVTRIDKKILVWYYNFFDFKKAVASGNYDIFKLYYDTIIEMKLHKDFFLLQIDCPSYSNNYYSIFCNPNSNITRDLIEGFKSVNLLEKISRGAINTGALPDCSNSDDLKLFLNAAYESEELKELVLNSYFFNSNIKIAIKNNNIDLYELDLYYIKKWQSQKIFINTLVRN